MGQSFLTTPHTRRRPKARAAVACLVLVAGLALFAGTAQARYQPGEPPGINPGEPTFTGAANPVPAEPVAYDPAKNMMKAIFDAGPTTNGQYWLFMTLRVFVR